MNAWLIVIAIMIISATADPVFKDGEFLGWGYVIYKTVMLVSAYFCISMALKKN
jgi:hypothetical protein